MVKFPTISCTRECTRVMLMILKELQWPWLARTHHGEVPHHLLHQGAHGGHVDDLEVISVDGPIGVHVLADLMQDAQQCHIGLSSTLLKQLPYTKGLSNTLMLTSYQRNVYQSCPNTVKVYKIFAHNKNLKNIFKKVGAVVCTCTWISVPSSASSEKGHRVKLSSISHKQ